MRKDALRNDAFLVFIRRHLSLAKFIFIGSLNTLLDLTLFAVLANLLDFHPVPASMISTGITLFFSFIMNHYFVFNSQKKKRHTIGYFFGITIFNVWVIQSIIIYSIIHTFSDVQFFQAHQWTFNMFAKLMGVCVSMVLNYLGYRFIFKTSGDTNDK